MMPEYYFDLETGNMIEVEPPHHPIEGRVPIVDLLTSEEFTFQKGDFEIQSARSWSPSRAIEIGKIVTSILNEQDPPIPFQEKHLERLHILGLFPDMNFLDRRFDNFGSFRSEVGGIALRDTSKYDKLKPRELVEHIIGTYEEQGLTGKISVESIQTMFHMGIGPSYEYIYERLGGVRHINEFQGFPDVSAWDKDDYLYYGVLIAQNYGLESLSIKKIEAIAKTGYGPYPQAIKKRFSQSWAIFRDEVEAEYKLQKENELHKFKLINDHFENTTYSRKDFSLKELQRVWGQYVLARSYFPSLKDTTVVKLSEMSTDDFIRNIIKRRPGLDHATLEIRAEALDVIDYVFPN